MQYEKPNAVNMQQCVIKVPMRKMKDVLIVCKSMYILVLKKSLSNKKSNFLQSRGINIRCKMSPKTKYQTSIAFQHLYKHVFCKTPLRIYVL